MALDKNDLQAIATLVQGVVKKEIEPLQEDIKSIKIDISNVQDDITDIKIQLNQIDNSIIKTRRQVLQEVRRLQEVSSAAFDDIDLLDSKFDQHISDKTKHLA